MDVAFLTIAELNRLYDQRELSPVEVTQALLDRIAAHDGKLHSFLLVTEEVALEQARAAERELMAGTRRGPLHGIPYALKDIIETAGIRTTGHSKLRQDHVPAADAEIVTRLKAGGGVLLGKLATWEFALGRPELGSAVAAGAEPVGHRAPAGRLVERRRGGGGGRVRARRGRHRYRRLGARPGGVVRPRRDQADLRPGQPPRRLPEHVLDGPLRPA